MSACIILENIPRHQARIDFLSCQVPEDFRGFREVPYGIHYVNIKSQNNYPNFWCFTRSDQIVVKFFRKHSQEFEDRTEEGTPRYQELASVGLLEETLTPYDYKKSGSWLLLTCHIKPEYFPIALHTSNQNLSPSIPSELDWERELFETHQGNFYSFIAEFQFAFIRWYVSDLDRPGPDAEAFNRWTYLVEATCNADKNSLAKAPELVNVLASALTSQFDSLENSLLPSNDPLVDATRLLQEKMIDGGIPLLHQEGQKLKTYLDERYGNFG